MRMIDEYKKEKVIANAKNLLDKGIIKGYEISKEKRTIKIFVYTAREKEEIRKEFETKKYSTIDSNEDTCFEVLIDKETDIEWKSLIKER